MTYSQSRFKRLQGVWASDDLLFIHIPKCGGMAVKKYLRTGLEGFEKRYPDLPTHAPLTDILARTDSTPGDWGTILVTIRDPVRRELSKWRFWREKHGEVFKPWTLHAAMREFPEFASDDTHHFRQHYPSFRDAVWTENDAVYYPHRVYPWWWQTNGANPPNVEVVRLEDCPDAIDGAIGTGVSGEWTQENRTENREPARLTNTEESVIQRRYRYSYRRYYGDSRGDGAGSWRIEGNTAEEHT